MELGKRKYVFQRKFVILDLSLVTVFKESVDENIPSFDKRLRTRAISEAILDPKTGEILLDRNHMLNDESVSIITNAPASTGWSSTLRSLLSVA